MCRKSWGRSESSKNAIRQHQSCTIQNDSSLQSKKGARQQFEGVRLGRQASEWHGCEYWESRVKRRAAAVNNGRDGSRSRVRARTWQSYHFRSLQASTAWDGLHYGGLRLTLRQPCGLVSVFSATASSVCSLSLIPTTSSSRELDEPEYLRGCEITKAAHARNARFVVRRVWRSASHAVCEPPPSSICVQPIEPLCFPSHAGHVMFSRSAF